jgi:hypothetical protein
MVVEFNLEDITIRESLVLALFATNPRSVENLTALFLVMQARTNTDLGSLPRQDIGPVIQQFIDQLSERYPEHDSN